MFFSKKKKKRVICNTSVIVRAMKNTMVNNEGIILIEFSYNGNKHKVGITSCHSNDRGFYDFLFFIGEQEFTSLEEFAKDATLDGKLFATMIDKVEVLKVDDVHPKHYTDFEEYVVVDE